MIERLRLREAVMTDAADQAEVFYHAVMEGPSGHYSLAQREAWASAMPREASVWQVRQVRYYTVVAEIDRRCVGFCELNRHEGRVEALYVWPALQGKGIASRLVRQVVDEAERSGLDALCMEASLTLAPRLLHHGWESLGEETVERSGEYLKRIRLRLALPSH
ncbi:GNAT family N-acetyltransferase [Larsenimonas rhizosphaerae]|uniref:GNAT family N-acetyltransferase n=1 Tax=Larsenimonas rhizosphaerae TaxID=2944682 RepID=A0AA41ZCJ3_9GAMM|nr:GNAT family N-acetyltransferase [Larsenimonas rhizosphaerae]MCX2522812.1 GNAT family N-acetyltransferase [Larsenimonas rhizosphaerae]